MPRSRYLFVVLIIVIMGIVSATFVAPIPSAAQGPGSTPTPPPTGGQLPAVLSGIREQDIDKILAYWASEKSLPPPPYYSHTEMPATIRVAITGNPHCGQPIQRIDTIDFKTYVKGVLPNEWYGGWHINSLKAGAMAAKMYAWYKINIRNGASYDVQDNDCDQVYIANTEQSTTNAAVDQTWNYVMRRNGSVIEIHYVDTDQHCRDWFPAGTLCMGQWESKYLADQGKDWQAILHQYYDPVAIEVLTPEAPTNINLIQNPGFDAGIDKWGTWGNITHSLQNGIFKFGYTSGTEWATIFQGLRYSTPEGSYFEVGADLGNAYSQPLTIILSLRSSQSWTGVVQCDFVVPANTSMRRYVARGKTSSGNWAGMAMEISTRSAAGGTQPFSVDNVSVVRRTFSPEEEPQTTECATPPTPNQNLVFNPSFSSGEAGWRFWPNPGIVHSVTNGVVSIYGLSNQPNAAAVDQRLNSAFSANVPFDIVAKFGNTSNLTKTVRLALIGLVPNNMDVSVHLVSCEFTIPSNTPLRVYRLYGKTNTVWPDIRLHIMLYERDDTASLIMDDISVTYRPDLNPTTTECLAPAPDTIGIFRPSKATWYLRYTNTPGAPNFIKPFGLSSDEPIVTDSNNNGVSDIGIYRPSTSRFYLMNGASTYSFVFGAPGDIPVAGDWNGDGYASVGVYRPSQRKFYLRNSNTSGPPDMAVFFGALLDNPVVGDWDGDGKDTVGVWRPLTQTFYLSNTSCVSCTASSHLAFRFGSLGDVPIIGDWDGNGVSGVGVYRSLVGMFYLRNPLTTGPHSLAVQFGGNGDKPVVGRWTAPTADEAPVFVPKQ